jgi:hypothetical protein
MRYKYPKKIVGKEKGVRKLKRRSLALLLILFIAVLTPFAAKTSVLSSTATAKQIIGKLRPPEVTIIDEDETGVTLNVEFFGFQRSQTEEDGLVLDVLTIPSCGPAGDIGKPAIPAYGTTLAVPFDVYFNFSILETESTDYDGYMVYPVQEPAFDDGIEYPTPPFYIDDEFYDTYDGFYPSMIVKYEAAGTLRDVRILPLRFTAFQHNPVQKVLRFYWSITLRIDYITEPILLREARTTTRAPSPYFESLYQSLLGYEQLSIRGASAQEEVLEPENTDNSGCDFLIITDEALLEAANRLAARRDAQGLSTHVVSTDIAGATAEDIKAYIQNAYDTWDPRPSYLLLLGDAELIPTFYHTIHDWYDPDIHTGTDLYYAILNGPEAAPPYYNEWRTPDIFYGRIPVDTLAQANIVIDKIFEYEDNQWMSGENTALVAGYFQDWNRPYGYEDRRFILTSEEIRDFLLGEGFQAERLYTTHIWPNGTAVNPTNYNEATYEAGDPLPLDLRRPTYPWDADTADITNAINDGRFVVFHRDHGGSANCDAAHDNPDDDGFKIGHSSGWGDPRYSNANVPALNNADHFTVVFSMNCETGWFDGETDEIAAQNVESFCELLLRESDGGAVGVFGATRVSTSGWNDDLAKGFVDAIWPNFDGLDVLRPPILRMGEVLNYGKLYMYNCVWPWDVRQRTFEMFHYFGDPTMAFKIPTLVVHDIAVTDVRPSPTTVIVGEPVSIEVDVLNEGTAEETFDLNVYYDTTLIGTVTVTLSAGASTTLTFTWDTTGVTPGTYTIKAEVPPVLGETDIDDNEFIDDKVTIRPLPVHLDIKPGSWPNPLQLKEKGVLPVAVCGSEDFDVTTIDPESIRLTLEGTEVAPLRWSYEDVATPYEGEPCTGHDLDGDGYLDLTLKFKAQEVIQTLGLDAFSDRDVVILMLTGNLKAEFGGTPIQGQDCIWILHK